MLEKIIQQIDEQTAAVLIQSPNFFGVLEPVKEPLQEGQSKWEPYNFMCQSLGLWLYASAAEIGADIAVGDCQPLGFPCSLAALMSAIWLAVKSWSGNCPAALSEKLSIHKGEEDLS